MLPSVTLGKLFTHVPLSPSGIFWYQPVGSDAQWLGSNPPAWQKEMTVYRRIYGFGHLQADCRGPGSAPEPYAHSEYGTTVPLACLMTAFVLCY